MHPSTPSRGHYRIALVGAGWRARFYLRIAEALPHLFTVVGVLARRSEIREEIRRTFHVPTHTSLDDMIAEGAPEYVVLSVPRKTTPSLIRHLDRVGMPVLAETPPAHHECGLRGLWKSLARPDLVQVAEQYPMLPTNQARLHLTRSGRIGEVTGVQVSSTHDYHAVALIRAYLGLSFEPVRVRALATEAPLLDPRTRDGLTRATTPALAKNTLATLQFEPVNTQKTLQANPQGEGRNFVRVGLYDFTTNQWHNQLRHRSLVVRGSAGEIRDNSVVYWDGPTRVVHSPILRENSGWDVNLEGFDTQFLQFEGEVLWKNRFEGARLSDEDIAIATMMEQMGRFTRGEGPAPYPLAEASQDAAIALAVHRASKTGMEVTVADEPWTKTYG